MSGIGTMMDILKSYKIGALDIKVKFDPNLMQDESRLGVFSPREQEIVLYGNISNGMQQIILIHELLEAIKYLYNIELKHEDINTLANCLHQILEDNYFKTKGKKNGKT